MTAFLLVPEAAFFFFQRCLILLANQNLFLHVVPKGILRALGLKKKEISLLKVPGNFLNMSKSGPKSPSQNRCPGGNGGVSTCGWEPAPRSRPQGRGGHSSEDQTPGFMGRRSCSSLALPRSSCRKFDAREQPSTFSCSREAASCLCRAGSVTLHAKLTQTFTSSLHFPTCQACVQRGALPTPPPNPASACASSMPLEAGPI